MATRLFIVYGSHPCTTVELALQRKGIAYRVIELIPPVHAPVMKALFGTRTVPAIRFDDGEKVSGSRAILRRLDARVPTPPLVPADADAAARVLEAERWGDEVFQSLGRTLMWPALAKSPQSIPSYQRGARLPALPVPVVRLLAPAITRAEQRLNQTNLATARAELVGLPAKLDHIDALIADGTIGGTEPNAADFQIAPSVRMLMTLADVRVLIEGRPLADWARRIAPEPAGAVPPGVLT